LVKIIFPQQVNIPRLLDMMRFAYARKTINEDHFIFDFSNMQHCPAFGLLLGAAFVRQFVENTKSWYQDREVYIEYEGYVGRTYPGHLGFFKSIGIDWGMDPGQAPGGDRYLPITQLNFDVESTMYSEVAKEKLTSEIQSASRRIAEMLTRQDKGDLFDNIRYSFVEIIRNVVEHSEQGKCWYCAQFWPTRNQVEIAILDEGVGIHQSMVNTGKLPIRDDISAMRYSVLPGISRHGYNTCSYDSTTGIGNAGFGLFMLSQLFGKMPDDKFAIYSGSRLLTCSRGKPCVSQLPLPVLQGTAIKISADTRNFTEIQARLDEFSQLAEQVYKIQMTKNPSATAHFLFGD